IVRVASLTPQRAARAATAPYHRLCTWPLKENDFLIMFPPAATWTRTVGLRG
ncbi:uncharacterized protein K441DRAFT_654285, partial [Cenococcum geophilum 1.58]|uniref:uncharacterized protein n=1 Tax=Cenococcum geophilum 1.58 TaxID=794803 RepID=UPI00358EFA16